jgi:hypothetical protein
MDRAVDAQAAAQLQTSVGETPGIKHWQRDSHRRLAKRDVIGHQLLAKETEEQAHANVR